MANAVLLALPLALLAPIELLHDAAVLAFVVLAVGWSVAEAVAQRETSPSVTRRSERWACQAQGLAILVVWWAGLSQLAVSRVEPTAFSGQVATWVGGAWLMVAGIGLRVAAIKALGSSFADSMSPIGPNPVLVSHGAYRFMAHPSEMGSTCLLLGGALLLRSTWALSACLLVMMPLMAWRVHLENATLRRTFGASTQG